MDISIINEDGEFVDAVHMPRSTMTFLDDGRFILQLNIDVKGSTERKNRERVLNLLFPDNDYADMVEAMGEKV